MVTPYKGDMGSTRVMQQLDDIEREHQLWLSSAGEQGSRAHFAGDMLEGINFAGRQLAYANFRGAVLTSADFSNADITHADFTEAVLQQAIFTNSRVYGAMFTMAQAQAMRITTSDMSGTNWQGAHLENAQLIGVQFSDAILRDIQASGSHWQQCDCTRVMLRGAILTNSIWEQTSLAYADFREIGAHTARFDGVIFTYTECRGADFSAASFANVDLSEAIELAPQWHALAFRSVETALAQVREQLRVEKEAAALLQSALLAERARMDNVTAVEARQSATESRFSTIAQQYKRYTTPLMALAALWCIIASMLFTIVIYQVCLMGADNLNMQEILVVLGLIVLLLMMHVTSAVMVYKASRAASSVQEEVQDD
jgi:uncharacterized protein YjbI with pentapeptide repeats